MADQDHRITAQMQDVFAQVTQTCETQFGFRFLTILKILPDPVNVLRVHSSSPDDYQIGALKPMGGTHWGKLVIDGGQTWLGNGADEVLWAFPDAQLILSKGCKACACAPVISEGKTVGVLSLNASLDAYTAEDLLEMSRIAQHLIPALRH
ncbi:GAF domain-containing protein [Pseudophaeobacter sp.]|uniref:GAF domain-containing protein n=1 Tax=Pseudophaeobacter sp. TaxID=1971739 RepID=UPI00260C61A4|nr:GAF domain-containing protein [Pseudophaeobacter sp.]